MRISFYIATVATAATLVTWLVVLAADPISIGQSEAVLWLMLLALVAQLQSFRLPFAGSGSSSFLPLLAAALLTPAWPAILAAALTHMTAELLAKRAPRKTVFNVAQMSLSMALAILVFIAIGGHGLWEFGDRPFLLAAASLMLPLLALVATFFAANSLLVSGVIALTENRSVLDVWRQNTLGTLVFDLLAAPIVFVFAWTYLSFGPLGAFALAVPLFAATQLYKTNRELERVNQDLLELMVKAIEARDPYTSGHSRRVAHFSRIIARAIGLGAKSVDGVAKAALLHDIGKIHEVYAPILRKPGRLSADEWAIMQTHPLKSAELVATVSHLGTLILPVRHHHENWDGTGYPDGLAGEAIPLESRIIMFADTIDAMTSDRPYRKAMTQSEVRAELARYSGRQFDPIICQKLLASPLFDLLFAPKDERVLAASSTPRLETVAASG
jgi:hypothetical protein